MTECLPACEQVTERMSAGLPVLLFFFFSLTRCTKLNSDFEDTKGVLCRVMMSEAA